eukprot:gene18895-54152_t
MVAGPIVTRRLPLSALEGWLLCFTVAVLMVDLGNAAYPGA